MLALDDAHVGVVKPKTGQERHPAMFGEGAENRC